MENEQEIIDSSTDTTVEVEQIDHSLDAETRAQQLAEQNKKLYARAKRAEGFMQDANGNWVKKQRPSEKQEIIRKEETQVKPLDILRDDAFKLYREGYDEEDIDLILRNGGRKILEDKNNPLTLGLQAKKEQRKAEEASRMASDSVGMTDVERKWTPEQLREMPIEELKKILPHA